MSMVSAGVLPAFMLSGICNTEIDNSGFKNLKEIRNIVDEVFELLETSRVLSIEEAENYIERLETQFERFVQIKTEHDKTIVMIKNVRIAIKRMVASASRETKVEDMNVSSSGVFPGRVLFRICNFEVTKRARSYMFYDLEKIRDVVDKVLNSLKESSELINTYEADRYVQYLERDFALIKSQTESDKTIRMIKAIRAEIRRKIEGKTLSYEYAAAGMALDSLPEA